MLKKAKWKNHPILGNLELDFSKPGGGVYNTIILAGENGTGKTTILETLSTFLNLGSIEPFEELEYVVNNTPYTIFPSTLVGHPELGFHSRRDSSGTETKINTNKNNNPKQIESDVHDVRHYGCSYSKARSGFVTQPITTGTTRQLDDNKYEEDKNDDFTSIKQLIVDVSIQDNDDFRKHAKTTEESAKKVEEAFKSTSKMGRFSDAFDTFFDNMTFVGVDNESKDEKRILFNKTGVTVPISVDDLSTGEKQVVFRGAHLLKNSKNLEGGVVLIDEPELSMHPKWQGKIFQYYRNLFKGADDQMSQIIFATHSDYVLRAGLADKDNVLIVVLNWNSGVIQSKRIDAPTVLPSITSAETNYVAFGIASNDYHIELYGHLQNKERKQSIKSCDTFIEKQHTLYDSTKHAKPSKHTYYDKGKKNERKYSTLPTYIRNVIDHPDPSRTFTQAELELSIKLLIELCK